MPRFIPLLKSLSLTALFAAGVFALILGLGMALHALNIHLHGPGDVEGPLSIAGSALTLGLVVLATFVIARIRKTSVLDFGLRDARTVRTAATGAVSGLAAFAVLMAALSATHTIHFAPTQQTLPQALAFAVIWAVGYTLTAAFEEMLFRGVPLAELTRGAGFPVAALLTSVVFGAIHLGNGAESVTAAAYAALLALLLALSVKLTGSLWWAIGFHAAWDWAESYLAGAPDSGITAQGRLFAATLTGPDWLSGAAAGPEGSVFMLAAATAGLGLLWLTRKRA